MSKERELLRKVVSRCWQIGTIPVVLHEEIENLLAQPEQEPSDRDWYGKGYGDATLHFKREPLSDEFVRKFADIEYIICNDAFIKGVRWTEAQHKIGE